MRTFDELEALWSAPPQAPRERGTVRLVVARGVKGGHAVLERGELTVAGGLGGDRWEQKDGKLGYQVTLMNARVAELCCDGELGLDAPGDNLLVDLDLGEDALPVGSRLLVGSALLEVTPEPHTGCKKFRQKFGDEASRWVNWPAFRERRLRGVNCRVVEGGSVAPGDPIAVL